MAKNLRKVISTVIVLALLIGVMSVTALAAPGNGTGQTQVHIHGVAGIAPNKSEVVIIVDGKEYPGTLQGSKLTIEMDSTDNGFDFGADESMDVEYRAGDQTGTLTLTHKEGNGNNIGKEHDKGLNNFNGTVKQPDPIPENETPTDETPKDETPKDEDNGDPMPEPEPNLPTSPREDPDVEIEVIPGDEPEIPNEEPPYVPDIDFPVIPPVVDEPAVEIEEPEVPLAEEPEIEEPIEEIPDEEVPLADVPYTGSMAILRIVLCGLSAAALAITGKRKQ